MVEAPLEKTTGAEAVIWDLSVFYAAVDDPAIDADMQHVEQMIDDFSTKYRGRVARLTATEMHQAYSELEAIHDRSGRLSSFASLTYAAATDNPQYGALLQKVTEFNARIGQKLVFFDLEWNEADDEIAQKLLDDPALGQYRHYLEAERRFKPYQLSEIEEQLLMDKAVTGRSAWSRFFQQLVSSMRLDYEGEQLPLEAVLTRTHDPDRAVRRKAADSVTAGLREYAMQLTYIFNVLAADKGSDDRRRGYPTWISSFNLQQKAPDETVEALIEMVTSSYDLVARHYHLKRTILGYDELTDYDRYAPLPLEDKSAFAWDESREIVLNAFSAFHPRFGEIAARFFDENWIHAPVRPGKRGGAFASTTVPSAHPFILVNYQGKSEDVKTLAHELGHGLHMFLACESQGLFGMHNPLTTSEMASTFAEMLVFTDMMQKEPDPKVRLMMLAQKIEQAFATVHRQVSMNRFEDALHNARRSEGELSTERISQLWTETQRAMFGDSLVIREDYGIWWAYVGHFVSVPGYVYAYAFGELLVLALFNLYKQQGADFIPKYIDVLAAGNSDYPEAILAKAGIDLADPDFWQEGIDALRELIEQEEALAREVYPDLF
jgi:oligoendopeptidase F